MAIKTVSSLSLRAKSDALLLPFFEGGKGAFSSKELEKLCSPPLKVGDFSGKGEEILCIYPQAGKEKRVVLVGLGKKGDLTVEMLRRAYGKAIGSLRGKAKSVNVLLPDAKLDGEAITEGVVEGVLLGSYSFDANKTKKEKSIADLAFIGADPKTFKHTKTVCDGVFTARDLIIENADAITPEYLAKTAKQIASKSSRMTTTVLNLAAIRKEKLGLLEAVSRAGSVDPSLILVEYKGAPKSKEKIALVGKGVTYDSGGLSLKPSAGMITMRDDMSGAAAVLGTLEAIASLQLPINVVGVVGATENMLGPKSFKLGDVYKSHAGITVEITNTDAEGRLVLADALSYVQTKHKPTEIVDIATLTGGVGIAYGQESSGIMSNDDALAASLIEAGEESFERLNRMPLYEEYEQLLQSSFADIKNSGAREATSIQGGIFLQHFIKEKTPWAHIDIGCTAFPDKLKGYQPVRAAGVGVRLFIKYLEAKCNSK